MTRRAALIVAVITALLSPEPVLAHDGLVRSVPARDAHLNAAPASLRLTFNRAPKLSLVRVALTGSAGAPVALEPLRIDSVATVVADIAGPIGPGVYRVAWQVTGADGHPVRGEFTFTVAAAPAGAGAPHAAHDGAAADTAADIAASHHDPVTMPGGEFGVQSPAYVAVRWVALSALVGLIGVVVFHFAVLGRLGAAARDDAAWVAQTDARLVRAGMLAAIVLVVATGVRLVSQSVAVHGPEALDGSLVRAMLLETGWGRAWIVQLLAAVAVALLLRSRIRSRWLLAAATGAVLAVAQASSGHARSIGATAIAADSVHVIAAAGWIGGLAALLAVGIPSAMILSPARRFATVADLVNRFSPMALAFAAVLALTGGYSAWLHLRSFAALWNSDYGQTLLWKLGVLSLVLATGAYNWKRVRPAVHENAGTKRLQRSAGIELAVAAVVIAITAVLVATPPPEVIAIPNPHLP